MAKFSVTTKMALLATAMGTVLAAAPANAQSDDSITVTAPHFRSDPTRLNGPLEKVSFSRAVRYDDLNLRTRWGARELRMRVRDEAQNICARLAEAYPVRQAPGTSCYKRALDDGLIRADSAIRDAREYSYED
jgi:UrcA family protein